VALALRPGGRPRRLADSARPPDPAGPFVGHHARSDWVAWRAGAAVEQALIRVDLAEHDTRTIATRRHLAATLARDVLVGTELTARVMGHEMFP